jgi:alpha-beta hydrolase superfamily lysophospholipase
VQATTLTSRDGLAIAAADDTLEGARARVVIVHGYAEHMGRYAGLVRDLTAAGFECHLFDLRGHGSSGGERGHVARYDDYLDDLALVLAHVRETAARPLPLLVVAHSLGGLIALSYVRREGHGIDALAVSSPFLRPGFALTTGQQLLAAVGTIVTPRLAVASTLDPVWLSHDPEVVRAYVEDPLVLRMTTPRWFKEVEHAQGALLEEAGEIRLPLLMLLGGGDRIADPQAGKELFARLGSSDKTLKTYDGLFHEVFNETAREAVVTELTAWLAAHS